MPARLSQDAVEARALVRNRHALARRIEVRQREIAALDDFLVRAAHLVGLVHEHELAEVIAQRRAREMARRRHAVAFAERLAAQAFVHRRALRTTPRTTRPSA